ncbi:bile acid:sodium symporter family protein [Wenyingzhuangia fucanilytica]|uniref:bile acid:sodium symporter family protein n=1 Tax=Wenyingzhuangia fucanilytica TaxID=1790137 RepID=UPI000B1C0448|nr:bile acid:sodium symporter family protein [Wenyingzhuangia fucanilytica]
MSVILKLQNIKIDKFILSLFLAIMVAFLFPKGAGILHLKDITEIGIGLIFFFYGLKLSFKEVAQGLKNYKLHILTQLSTFLIFPVLLLLLKPFFSHLVGDSFWIGLFFLAALPSSVSSSVVMVSLAKGNVPSAIFNASISGLIGVFVTPIWIGMFVSQSGGMSLTDVFLKLIIQILLPLTLGLLLNSKIGHIAKKNSVKIAFFDKTIIVLIVYSSFSASLLAHMFKDISWLDLIYLFIIVFCLFWVLMGVVYFIANKLKLSVADRITAMFCGSKKSLVHGSAMVNIIFGNSISASLYLLPVMLYHITQIVILAVVANRLGKRTI